MTKRPIPTAPRFPGRRSPALHMVPLALLLAAGGTGCYRATGINRPTVVAEQIPLTGGDRVAGNKATAGAGDYYLGNDYMHLAVDGAVFGDRLGQFDAPSGGAILDIGGIALDQSFKRVSLPTDNVERIGPVANQDPDLPLVFDHFSPLSASDAGTLTMTGYLLDPKHKLAGATWDSRNRVVGVLVEHTITLPNASRSFDLLTTVRNTGTTTLPLRNIADYLHQSGGGFRFMVPAVADLAGTPISTWGAEIPGSDFTDPLGTSVQSASVALMGAEPSAATFDMHQSLGILPMDQDRLLVASDPQQALEENRPRFPARLVAGSLPVASLTPGATLTYHRRIYQISGPSLSIYTPAQASGVFNNMTDDLRRAGKATVGFVGYATAGSAVLRGPRQTEIKFERYTGSSPDPSTDSNPAHWVLERVEWREPGENYSSTPFSLTPILLPAVADASHPGLTQPYRVTTRNRDQAETDHTFLNLTLGQITGVYTELRPTTSAAFQISNFLSPERSEVTTDGGSGFSRLFLSQGFATTVAAAGTTYPNAYQPLRITMAGLDSTGAMDPSKDPSNARARAISTTLDVVTRSKFFVNLDHGAYQFTAGNQIFGSAFVTNESSAAFYFPHGSFLALGTRGPLGPLGSLSFDVADGQPSVQHTFLVFKSPVPSGWTSFDLPGPSQITSGGMLPAEQLSSALAENIQVVGRTEKDQHTDATALATEFLQEFDSVTAGRRQAIDGQLYTFAARSSYLSGDTATALFTPGVTAGQARGGARASSGWTLADFIAQAQGQYTVLHRPRGPQGLFKREGGIAAGVPLGSGANAWWSATDPKSEGKATGDFDAIELLRAEGCNPADPSAWFAEFKALRSDWFNLLNLQTPSSFTKGLGLSSGIYSLDTPVGLARTYLKTGTATLTQADLTPVLSALRAGAAVASTGPLLDVNLNGSAGPGSLLAGPAASAVLNISLYSPSWVPVQEVRIVVNGVVVLTLDPSIFTQSTTDSRLRTTQVNLPLATMTGNKDAWVVVEAGVPLATSGAYAVGTPWNKVMKGIYPIAVANPIFVDVNGSGYTSPLP